MDLRPLYALGFVTGTTLAMLVVVQLVERIYAARTLHHDLRGDNEALRFSRVGQLLGISILAAAAVHGSAEDDGFLSDLGWVAAFGGAGLVLSLVTWELGLRLLLRDGTMRELERGNQAAGIASGAQWVAVSIVTARSMSGRGIGELGLSLTFFVLAQLALHLLAAAFRLLTVYDDADQIHGDNRAAALSYGGALIAIALLVGHAVEGEFTGWRESLVDVARTLAAALLLYPVRQLIVQTLLLRQRPVLRGGAIDRAISVERSVAVGALEATAYLATALAVLHLAS